MPGPVAQFYHRPEFRPLAPWPPGLRYRNGPVERILQGQLPLRLDNPARALIGSSAGQAADSELAEPGAGDLIAARQARDAERQRRKRAGGRAQMGKA